MQKVYITFISEYWIERRGLRINIWRVQRNDTGSVWFIKADNVHHDAEEKHWCYGKDLKDMI